MDVLVFLAWSISFLVFWGSVIVLVINKVRKKPLTKQLRIMVACFVVGLCSMIFIVATACNHQYEMVSETTATCTAEGETVSICSECGYEKIEVIPATGHDIEVVSEVVPTIDAKGTITERCSVCGFERVTEVDNADLIKAYEEEQERLAIEQAEQQKLEEEQKQAEAERLAIEQAEQEKLEEEQRQAEAEQLAIEQAEAERLAVTFDEIYLEYKANELRAEETYKNNRYVITAEINSMATGGLLNWSGGATLTMTCKVDNTLVFFLASFEKGQEEALKTINVGDTITFDGKCLSAGSWSDCELILD